MNAKFNKALILAPHTDDGELGCGASIVKLIKEGTKVHYAAFSSCEESVPSGFPKDVLKFEMKKATNVLGIKKENVKLFFYPVRRFSEHRQDILENIIALRNEISSSIAKPVR